MAENKLKRLPNFSSAEESLLLELVGKHASILENKRTDAVSWDDKKKAWERINIDFEAQMGVKRGPKNLKEKYDNLKRKARKNLAEERREVYKTGGGQYTQRSDPNTERLAALMGQSATGFSNNFDSDATTYEIESIERLDESMASFTVEPVPEAAEAVEQNATADWSSWSPSLLQQKKSEKLCGPKKSCQKAQQKKVHNDSMQEFWKEEKERAIEKHEWAKEEKERAIEKHEWAKEEKERAIEKHEWADEERVRAVEKHEWAKKKQALETKEVEMRIKLLQFKKNEMK